MKDIAHFSRGLYHPAVRQNPNKEERHFHHQGQPSQCPTPLHMSRVKSIISDTKSPKKVTKYEYMQETT